MSIKCGNQKCLNKATKLCGNCKIVSYCSAECQKADWKLHKQACKKCSQCDKKLGEDAVFCPCQGTRVCPGCYESCECVAQPKLPQYESNENCVVCLEEHEHYTSLPCNHKVCTSCWKKIGSQNGQCCPVCRRFVNSNEESRKTAMKSSEFLQVVKLTQTMIEYCDRSSKTIRIKEQHCETANLIHAFTSGMIQHSSKVELSVDEELVKLGEIYEKIVRDQEAIYYGLFKSWAVEFNRASIPTGSNRHLILSIIPKLIGPSKEDHKNGGEALWKMWNLDLSLRN